MRELQVVISYHLPVVSRQFQADQQVTPAITAVAEFIASLLSSDCPGEKDLTYLTLRVGRH
jgi:hypothetical protein